MDKKEEKNKELELEENEESFEEYMIFFKGLDLKEKQDIVIEQLKFLAAYTNSMCSIFNINNDIIINSELSDLKKENYTEDDFAEAAIVLINSIQCSLNDFNEAFDKATDSIIEHQQ